VALKRRHIRLVVLAVVLSLAVPLLAYLRDPPWLLATASGFRGWEQGTDGTRFRWMGGHASFFVSANAHTVELPVRTSLVGEDWPITLSVSIDDRPADRIVLADGEWHSIMLRLPPPGRRRVRRVDIRLDRTRDEDHGAAIGEPRIQ
jgi:hypothetical protein